MVLEKVDVYMQYKASKEKKILSRLVNKEAEKALNLESESLTLSFSSVILSYVTIGKMLHLSWFFVKVNSFFANAMRFENSK
jgi:hypothetical protein